MNQFPQNPQQPQYPFHPSPPQQPTNRTAHQIIDQQYRVIAVTFEHPSDWQAQSHLQWNMQNNSLPVQTFARAYNPNGAEMVEFFPVQGFYWIEPNLGFGQMGQESGGMALMQPMSAADAMMRWILPKFRSEVRGQVVGVQPLPQLAQMLNLPPTQNAMQEGVQVRIEYQINGTALEEDFYALKTAYQGIPTYGAAGTLVQYNWGFDRLFSFRALKGQLDSQREMFWSVVRSTKVNPQWEQLYGQVIQQLAQQFNQHLQDGYAQINAATQMSKQISANNDAWLQNQQQQRDAAYHSDQMRRQQEQNSGSNYTTNDAFGDYIMGRETYNDPNNQYGSQHSGYHETVWTDGQGNYQYGDSSFNPNTNSSVTWTQMQKKQIGQ